MSEHTTTIGAAAARPSPEYGGSSDVPGGRWDPAAVTEPDRKSEKLAV